MSRSLALVLSLCCTAPAVAESVDFEHTYCIPLAGRGESLTHVPAVQFTADGRHLVAGASTGEVFLWRRNAQLPARRFRYSRKHVQGAAVDPTGRYLVIAYRRALVAYNVVWPSATGACAGSGSGFARAPTASPGSRQRAE